MADKKISALTAASTPLAGTEVLPIVQSSATVKVSVANLTAGRAISATELTLTTGNLIVASGQGVDFSATPGTGLSELLADYEEGTWTPTLATDGTNFTSVTYDANTGGRYVKVGKLVHIQGWLRTDSVTVGSASGNLVIAGLPFTAAANTGSTSNGQSNVTVGYSGAFVLAQPSSGTIGYSSTTIYLWYKTAYTSGSSNLVLADAATGGASNYVTFTATYVST